MTKEEFHCYYAGPHTITDDYCLEKCNSPQKGVKAYCPSSVRPQLPEERKPTKKELEDLGTSIANLEKPEMREEGEERVKARIGILGVKGEEKRSEPR